MRSGTDWQLGIADASPESLKNFKAQFPLVDVFITDVQNNVERGKLVSESDIIISLLPARFHTLVAADCLTFKKHLITPSYISPEMKTMSGEVERQGLIFLNELGLDPGIDHMSAMKIIHRLQSEGAEIESFKSYCGGLISEESNTNPWHYKISWNPYNIIRAGQDGGICLVNGKYKYLPYNRLFSEAEEMLTKSSGSYDAYLNRSSLPYIDLYGLTGIKTFLRGTLRYSGFGRLWQFLVNTGITNDKIVMEELLTLSWKDFFEVFMPLPGKSFEENFYTIMNSEARATEIAAMDWINFHSDEKLPVDTGTPAQLLQILLEEKWKLAPGDKDRVVMLHEFIYTRDGEKYKLQSVLDLIGGDEQHTAMARTVGMPLALAAELIVNDKIQAKGVLLPIIPEVYEPLMELLHNSGIIFVENEEKL